MLIGRITCESGRVKDRLVPALNFVHSPFALSLMISHERAAFQAEVAQVEQWFEVWPLSFHPLEAHAHFETEPTLCAHEATLHRCPGRFKARVDPDPISL